MRFPVSRLSNAGNDSYGVVSEVLDRRGLVLVVWLQEQDSFTRLRLFAQGVNEKDQASSDVTHHFAFPR